MNFEKAILLLRQEYEAAQKNPTIQTPISYALYRTSMMVRGSENKKKSTTDLTGKCGNCSYAVPTKVCGSDYAYIECRHPDNSSKNNEFPNVRRRTNRACKKYKKKTEEVEQT